MFIAKDAPGSAPGDLHWESEGDVVEVTDPKVAAELLRMPGFRQVEPPAKKRNGAVVDTKTVDV